MLKKFFISLSIVLSLSFTSCGGGSSDEAKELLSKILQFVGIPHNIIVNVCQDSNLDGVCGGGELFTKLTIKKGESISDILRKISLTPDGKYFLRNVDPTLPILVEFQDEAKVNQNSGKFTLEFDAFENEEQNETKEISILEAMVDADGLTKAEADKFRTLRNKEAQDKYYATLLNDLETNINTLRANGLDNKKAVIASIKEMADETKTNQERADKINGCENNQTCVDEEIKKISDELIITEDEATEIKSTQETNNTTPEEATPTAISGAEEVYGKWVKPSQSICESNGGYYIMRGFGVDHGTKYQGTTYTDCHANWKNAHTICSDIRGSLPTKEVLGAVVTDCGGVIDEEDNNRDNESYQACYRERGFDPGYYWSSTASVSDTRSAWGTSFSNGHVVFVAKRDSRRVRCVRGQ